jgi:transposase-like protein
MPLDAVPGHLKQQHDIDMSESGIYNWVIRFAREAVERARDFKPNIGDTWVADETMIDVGGRKVWYWDIIDADSRFLLASRISLTRTTKDAALLMHKAATRAGKTPKRVVTDKLNVYLDGVELTFGADAKHVQSAPFVTEDSTNLIERFHGTLKDRTDVIRGFKNLETAQLLTDAWLVYYNFMKEHTSLNDRPPAVAMGKPVPFHDWDELLQQVKQDLSWPKGTSWVPTTTAPVVHSYARSEPKAGTRRRAPAKSKQLVTPKTTLSSMRVK